MGTVRKSFGFFKRVPILSVRTVSFRCKEQLLRFRNSVPVHLKIYDRCIVFCNVDTKNRRNHQQFLPNGSLNSVHVQISIDNLSVLNRRRFVAAGRSLISKEQTNQSKTPGGRKKGSRRESKGEIDSKEEVTSEEEKSIFLSLAFVFS
jgi:hypothetical protein